MYTNFSLKTVSNAVKNKQTMSMNGRVKHSKKTTIVDIIHIAYKMKKRIALSRRFVAYFADEKP